MSTPPKKDYRRKLPDVQVGARALETGIWGAWQNVRINMIDIEDEAFKAEILREAEQIAERARDNWA